MALQKQIMCRLKLIELSICYANKKKLCLQICYFYWVFIDKKVNSGGFSNQAAQQFWRFRRFRRDEQAGNFNETFPQYYDSSESSQQALCWESITPLS
jgi:hypothetical protein